MWNCILNMTLEQENHEKKIPDILWVHHSNGIPWWEFQISCTNMMIFKKPPTSTQWHKADLDNAGWIIMQKMVIYSFMPYVKKKDIVVHGAPTTTWFGEGQMYAPYPMCGGDIFVFKAVIARSRWSNLTIVSRPVLSCYTNM